jgi:hypothetical protein
MCQCERRVAYQRPKRLFTIVNDVGVLMTKTAVDQSERRVAYQRKKRLFDQQIFIISQRIY